MEGVWVIRAEVECEFDVVHCLNQMEVLSVQQGQVELHHVIT